MSKIEIEIDDELDMTLTMLVDIFKKMDGPERTKKDAAKTMLDRGIDHWMKELAEKWVKFTLRNGTAGDVVLEPKKMLMKMVHRGDDVAPRILITLDEGKKILIEPDQFDCLDEMGYEIVKKG